MGERRPARTELTVGAVPCYHARIAPGRCALADGERQLSYGELDAQVQRLASAIRETGVGRGDVVCTFLPNCIEFVLVVLAVARAGAIFSPINTRFKGFETTAILRQARPRMVFASADAVPMLQGAIGASGIEAPALVLADRAAASVGGARTLESLLAADPVVLPEVDEDEDFSLMFTSGTTGESKGAVGTHRARMMWVVNAAVEYGVTSGDRCLGTMPLVHSAGLTFTLIHLYAGATVRLLRHFDAAGFLDLVERERITSALAVPTMLTMILEAIDARPPAPGALASLRRLLSCGSPLPFNTRQRVMEKLCPHLYDYYGSTESNSMSILRPEDQLAKPDSVGRAFRNVDLMIAAEDGSACAPGVVGEIWSASPSVMRGYRDRPEETAAAFVGRWYRTGDLGFLDPDGFLHIVGRSRDMIISGGVNIYPAEIERVLMLHPAILDAAVVGVADAKWGQAVKAYIVQRATGPRLSLEAVQRHCAEHLADFKKPRSLAIVESLPKNAGGKTVKAALVDREAARAG